MFVKHKCPRWLQMPKLTIFSIKVTVKVTRSLTLVSFERVSLFDYACQNMKSISNGSKVMAKVKGFFCLRVTDRTKIRCPWIPLRGHKKYIKQCTKRKILISLWPLSSFTFEASHFLSEWTSNITIKQDKKTKAIVFFFR